ncbi:protein of unknown function [Acidithiobacillus ferrivorans]|uniref:Uncharacterized protein n=1 Tax=Acidithiobacillus ferrivorans TaxID=160808 RepID=A0A060US72_9PROT|nr:hypothetical protein AFERRI_530056 [Acidithiobacillus ferrivorans]SMH67522.1 protein of unknown function [Acidithiobacillus ferrivorans]
MFYIKYTKGFEHYSGRGEEGVGQWSIVFVSDKKFIANNFTLAAENSLPDNEFLCAFGSGYFGKFNGHNTPS